MDETLMDETLELEMVVPEAQATGLQADVLAAQGEVRGPAKAYEVPATQLELFGDQQFEPLTVLTVVVSVAFLADRISRLVQRHKGVGGVVIDARGERPTLIETKALDPGEIVVIGPNGPQVFREDGIHRALAAVAAISGP